MLKRALATIAVLGSLVPHGTAALTVAELFAEAPVSARSYIVLDKASGQVLAAKDPDAPWIPASMTKLVTALVVLDSKPNWKRTVRLERADEVGGVRVAGRPGTRYTVKDLFYATLVPSANNAANALARSTGLSRGEFVARMNEKARALGARSTSFVEPSGISELNITTASDYARIVQAALGHPDIRAAALTERYTIRPVGVRTGQVLKNTNRLLNDPDLPFVGGKTGYLDESRYNFAAEVRDRFGSDFVVVTLGSPTQKAQFEEIKQLVAFGGLSKAFPAAPVTSVLGTSTTSTQATVSAVTH